MENRSNLYEKIAFLGEGQVLAFSSKLPCREKSVKNENFSSNAIIRFEFQFATVYKAKSKDTGEMVAVKKVNESHSFLQINIVFISYLRIVSGISKNLGNDERV